MHYFWFVTTVALQKRKQATIKHQESTGSYQDADTSVHCNTRWTQLSKTRDLGIMHEEIPESQLLLLCTNKECSDYLSTGEIKMNLQKFF